MFAATFAKLNVGLTFGAGTREDVRGDEATGTVDEGGVRGRTEGRSDPVRELVLDMDDRSRSLSRRSAISLSRAETSTGLWRALLNIEVYSILSPTWRCRKDSNAMKLVGWDPFWVKKGDSVKLMHYPNAVGDRVCVYSFEAWVELNHWLDDNEESLTSG